ncbi:MAG: dienelactone hydrolase family protein [Aestuariivirga sp.]|uniref:alpha/beta hydrolase n=1 Tax=Aestuariivirga sp. TaxID=2650926 RepID=UPI0025C1E99D|nr:dienelactone hydrolase family protein [Aestuariivirga sp.]MCA3559486.1 dienelactone hydrolase family protein [Aestuariivirga sp.]
MSNTLDAVIERHALARAGAPPSRAKGVVLLIHGRGASAESMLPLADVVAMPDLCYLAPQADGYTWYPQSFMAPTAANEPSLSRALDRVAGIIADILEAGIAPGKLAVVGFSQGACLTSETVLRNPRAYGFVGVLSGGAIGPPGAPRDYVGSLAGATIFLGCSDQDPHIPLARVKETTQVFTRMGAAVWERIYPGASHGINDDEITHLRAGLAALAT